MAPSERRIATPGLASLMSLGLLLGIAEPVGSYEPETHREISATAINRSSLDDVLKTQYGVDEGILFAINGENVRTWVEIGAVREDVPPFRSLNHFHNPLKPWAQAGGLLGQSSVYWQQTLNQGIGGTWSWPMARQRLFDFLTLPSPVAREQALADTARALGHVMHLVQDAASPAHTREDPHPIHDGYEARIEELRASLDAALRSRFEGLLAAPSILPATSVFTPTGDPQAPVPVARSIDSDTYRGTVQSYAIGAQVGLAEYTNGGYVSDDTIFLDFALPRRESLGAGFFDPPAGTSGARQYFPKVREGDAIPHFVAEGALLERLRFRGQPLGGFILDDKVYEDYAVQLLPRAVGYSAALLNDFLRSNFDFTIEPNGNDPARRDLTIRIPPSLSAETMDGTFTLYADDRDGIRSPVPGASITAALPRGASAQTVFTPASGVRAYVLVFHGTLGNEPAAVAGKVSPVGPFVFAIQGTAEFSGEEERASVIEVDTPSTFRAVERRSKDARKQRAKGTFFSPVTSDPGQHLKRVSLEFDPRMVGTGPVQFLLDDVDVGVEWNQATSTVQDPNRWEIRVDLPAYYGGGGRILVPNVPRFVVIETMGGVKIKTPLVWWRSVSSLAEARAAQETVTACPLELRCEEVVSNGTVLQALVFFGDGNGEGRDRTPTGQRHPLTAVHTSVGFTPTGVVAGYGVGTVDQSGNLNCFTGCTPAASCSTSTVNIFAASASQGPVWTKDEFFIGLGDLSGGRKPANTCVRPNPARPAAPDLPELRFRRDYLPPDQSRFQEFAVTPPEYEITLK